MRTKLRAPLMLEQVEQMMATDPVRGQEFWIEFTYYWTGYINALSDAGMITDNGKERLLAFVQSSACDEDSCPVEESTDTPVDPSTLMQELTKAYPELAQPAPVDASKSPDIIPDAPKEKYSWQR